MVVEVPAVYDKDDLLHARNLREVVRHLVRGQGLARARRMPDEARLRAAIRVGVHGIADGLNRMDLVRTQQDDGLALTVEDRILRHHLVRSGDRQDRLGKR